MHSNTSRKFANLRSNKGSNLPLSALTCLLLAASGAYAYTEAGVSGSTSSWESAEYKKDWGLVSMNASTAYALGFNGSGIKIGVMDSGVLLSHPEFQDGRIHTVKTIGNYSKNGMRYPDAALGNGPIDKNQPVKDGKRNFNKNDNGVFKKGEAFNGDGSWVRGVNDAHGTHVGGTMAASRDGSGMHGVAFGAQLYSANTGGNDNMTYGPNQDYNYFLKGYTALADAGAKVINNSWGSNRRVNSSFAGALGYKPTYGWRAVPEYDVEFYDVTVANQTTAAKDHINLKDMNEAKKAYYQFVTSGEKSFLDAAYEVAVKRGVIQIFTAGNRSLMAESFTRAALPYFRPDAEDYWINVTGQTGADGYPNDSSAYIRGYKASSDIQEFNLAGHSKWWTIAAPSSGIYSAYVELTDNANYGKAIYKSSGGTSMAAPHVSGALGVIMQRYPYMSMPQIRETMLTTARQRTLRAGHGAGGMLERWGSDGEGVPSNVWGWGILDLGKAMFGPGQFLGNFDITMNQNDIWTNNISDVAIKFRKTEDDSDAAAWAARRAALNAKSNLSAEEKAEMTFETAREQARAARAAEGYEGSLTKRGDGALTLVGDNSFTGAVNIYGGKISVLNQSISSSRSINVHKGGEFEVLNALTYQTPSAGGFVSTTKASDATQVNAVINAGGAFVVNDGAHNLNLTFKEGSLLKAALLSNAELANLAANPTLKKIINASGNFAGVNLAKVEDSYAFFKTTKETVSGSNLALSLQKGKSMEEVASTSAEKSFARLVEANPSSAIYSSMLGADRNTAAAYFGAFSNDLDFKAQNNSAIDSFMLANSVKNKNGAKRADIDTGVELWLLSSASRVTSDNNAGGRLGTNAFTNLVGVDFLVGDSSKAGVFVGLGKTNHKLGDSKAVKSKDAHAGIYGDIGLDPIKISLGAIYSKFDQEKRVVNSYAPLAYEYKDADASAISAFAQIAYTGLSYENGFSLEPYAGLTYVRFKNDDVANSLVQIRNEDRDLQVASVGVKPSIAFTMDGVGLIAKADVAYNRFLGDKTPSAHMNVTGLGATKLEGEKLKDLATTELGIEAAFTRNFRVGLSYVGAYGSNVKSNGVNAKFSWAF